MTPERSIESLSVLLSRIDTMRAEIERSANHAAAQWAALGKIGGQRADHAAALLDKQLYPSIASLRSFLERVETQICAMQSNPFADSK